VTRSQVGEVMLNVDAMSDDDLAALFAHLRRGTATDGFSRDDWAMVLLHPLFRPYSQPRRAAKAPRSSLKQLASEPLDPGALSRVFLRKPPRTLPIDMNSNQHEPAGSGNGERPQAGCGPMSINGLAARALRLLFADRSGMAGHACDGRSDGAGYVLGSKLARRKRHRPRRRRRRRRRGAGRRSDACVIAPCEPTGARSPARRAGRGGDAASARRRSYWRLRHIFPHFSYRARCLRKRGATNCSAHFWRARCFGVAMRRCTFFSVPGVPKASRTRAWRTVARR